MSDQSQGPGWWYASDGKWYPPQPEPVAPVAPSPTAPAPTLAPPAVAPPTLEPSSGGGSKVLVLGIAVLVVLLIGAGLAFVVTRGGSGTAGNVTSDAAVSGPDEMPGSDLVLGDRTVVVRGNGGKTLKSVASDGSTFTLDGAAEGVDRLGEGSVLLLTGVTVVKIKSVERSGADVVVKTAPAAITDVIKDGSLKWDSMRTGPGTLNVWDATDADHEVKEKGEGSSEGGDGSSGGDGGSDSGRFGPGPIAPGVLGQRAPFDLPGVVGAAGQADAITKSGKVGDFSYSYDQTGGLDGSSTYKITITKEGNLLIKLDLEASIEPIISSGDLHVQGSSLDRLHLKTDKFNGKAKVHIEAGTGEDIAPVKQEILSLPIEVKYPLVIYGIPFYLGIKGKFLLEPAFTSRNSTIQAQGEVTFGGSAGLTWQDGSLSAEGALVTKREDPISYIDGLGVGVTGMIFAAQFPRVSFGLGYGSSTAGVFLASTTSVGATVGSAVGIVKCKQVTITETVSAGADAQFLGIDLPLGKKATAEIKKETWSFYDPQVNACKI